MKQKIVECKDRRPCFARGAFGACRLLTEAYEVGKCPFCKPEKEVTNDVFYPYKGGYAE